MATRADRPRPQPAYIAAEEGPLRLAPDVLRRVAEALDDAEVVDELVVPIRSGRSWIVPAGHVCRLRTIDGPQVFDLNLWSRHDPRERFWASRTRQFYGTHISVGARLWSCLPFLRPLATVVADTLAYGIDEDGAGCHDLLGTRCDPYVTQVLSGKAYDFHCHSNLVRAVQPRGLTEFDVHDVLNVFQVTGLTEDDRRYFLKPSPARPGDHFDLLAETDLLMAGSACPGGDLAVPMWGPDAGAEPNCNPIGVQVLRLDPAALEGWAPNVASTYAGMSDLRHGLRSPAAHPSLTSSVPLARPSS